MFEVNLCIVQEVLVSLYKLVYRNYILFCGTQNLINVNFQLIYELIPKIKKIKLNEDEIFSDI